MENYKTVSTSLYSARLAEPVVIEENTTTRKVLIVDLNDKKKEVGETVGITIVHQRKKKNDEWEDIESINLNSLKGGEGVKLNLDSKNTRKIYDELSKLYAPFETKHIGLSHSRVGQLLNCNFSILSKLVNNTYFDN